MGRFAPQHQYIDIFLKYLHCFNRNMLNSSAAQQELEDRQTCAMALQESPWIIRAFRKYRGPEDFYVCSPGDSERGYGSMAMRITVEAQTIFYKIDTAPLVKVEMYLSMGRGVEEQICNRITDVYVLLRVRGEPWYKIEAIPWQIYASAEVKEVVYRSLRLARDIERATIFKRCFPTVDCDKGSMGPLEELDFLRKAGYEEFPLSTLRERRCLVQPDSIDFEREENCALSRRTYPLPHSESLRPRRETV
ncbi:MAG: hypothetical protein Q9228_007846 [Teloschistes exilis]